MRDREDYLLWRRQFWINPLRTGVAGVLLVGLSVVVTIVGVVLPGLQIAKANVIGSALAALGLLIGFGFFVLMLPIVYRLDRSSRGWARRREAMRSDQPRNPAKERGDTTTTKSSEL